MFDTQRIKSDFSKAASVYDENAVLQKRVLKSLVEKTKPLITENAHILDAGCGTGQLAKLLPKHKVTQLDISYAMCKEAAKNTPAITADIEYMPFPDASFDIVFSSLVFQWLPDWHFALKEIKRVLKPDGVIAISTLGSKTLHELKKSFAQYDDFEHVSPFLKGGSFWKKEAETEYFPDLHAIMRALKSIGANNKLAARRKSMMTLNQLQNVENFYRKHFNDSKGLKVTWEVLYHVSQGNLD